jgi:hypothetical protein
MAFSPGYAVMQKRGSLWKPEQSCKYKQAVLKLVIGCRLLAERIAFDAESKKVELAVGTQTEVILETHASLQ